VYITYAKKWFVDKANFGIGTQRYKPLPPLLKQSSREERSNKRR
jgi:hypothetical protein